VKYAFRQPTQPCAVLCLKCAGDNERLDAYRGYRQMPALGDVVLFLR
jgi:hypothetical protein